MKIGVVCEGITDFHAISCFFGKSLEQLGILTEFVALQPEIDNTQPEAGWGNVFYWFKRNPWMGRIQKYFEGGLFGGELTQHPYSCILVHLDTDILGEAGFNSYVLQTYGHTVCAPALPDARASEIRTILRLAAEFNAMTAIDTTRHVLAPAVESTEAWCIAAFHPQPDSFEQLSGRLLIDRFMAALETVEGRVPTPPYATINKDTKRRKRLCEELALSHERIATSCEQYKTILTDLVHHHTSPTP